MKPLSELDISQIKHIRMVSFDVDGVLVKKGTDIIEQENENEDIFYIKTKKISPSLLEKLIKLKEYLHVNISSGRSLLYLLDIFEDLLWNNATLQSENGLFTLMDGRVIQHTFLLPSELELLRRIKNELQEMKKQNGNIRGFEPKQFLISIHCYEEDSSILNLVNNIDKTGILGIKWSSEAYNIFPKRVSKATGIKELATILNIELSQILVTGNDPNDREAVEGPGISVTTSPETLSADYYTEDSLELGGESLVNKLLEMFETRNEK